MLRLTCATRIGRSVPDVIVRQDRALYRWRHLHATCRALGFDVDYKRLLREFQRRGTLLRAYYFMTIIEDQEYSSVRPLIDWLGYNGYTVFTKLTKEFIDVNGRRKMKGSMSIELAVNAMEIADHIDQMFLFSGDGDFARCWKRCSAAASTLPSSPPSPVSRRWWLTNCGVRPMPSSILRN